MVIFMSRMTKLAKKCFIGIFIRFHAVFFFIGLKRLVPFYEAPAVARIKN